MPARKPRSALLKTQAVRAPSAVRVKRPRLARSANGEEIMSASTLPAITFAQVRLLSRAGTPFRATIRAVEKAYAVEVDVGPRRWVLISTHRKHPRLFQHLDGAANTVRRLGAQQVHLQLDAIEELVPSAPSPHHAS